MSVLAVVRIGQFPVDVSVKDNLLRLLRTAGYRFCECTLYVEAPLRYRNEGRIGSSNIRITEQRKPPRAEAPLCAHILIHKDDEYYPCYLAPPEGTSLVRFIKRLLLAQAIMEDEIDDASPKEVISPGSYAVTGNQLLSLDASPQKAVALLDEWTEQMNRNLAVIHEVRSSLVNSLLSERDELRKQLTGQPVSSGFHQALKKKWRMYRILQAIKHITRSNGDFDPGLALESIKKTVPEEKEMSEIRFRKLGTADKYYQAHRSGPFALYYITPKGNDLLAEFGKKDPKKSTI